MERRGLVWVMVVVVASLAATALLPTYLKRGGDGRPAAEAGRGAGSGESFVGTLPATFAVDGGLSGDSPAPGFDLPNSTRLQVKGTKVSAKKSREVARLLGADRLTGKESLSVDGTFDRKTDRIDARVVWTLKGRAGNRVIDWRFDGRLKTFFNTSTSLKGTLAGKVTERDTYDSSTTGAETSTEDRAWTYAAIRGK